MPPPKIKPKAPPRRGAAAAAAAASASTAGEGEGSGSTQGPTIKTEAGDGPAETATPGGVTPATPAAAATTRSIAPPQGRLDSLRAGGATPGPAGGAGGSAAGAPGGPSARGKAPLRFKPKAVARKTAEERAALEAKVAPVIATPTPEAKDSAGRGRGDGRGRGGRGFSARGSRDRGRGGPSRGRGGGDFGVASTASGPFALGSVTSGRSKVILERGGGEGVRSAYKSSYKSGSGGKRSRNVIIGPDGVKIDPDEGLEVYSSSDEESDGGPKVNVEHLEELGDSEEDEEGYEDEDGDVVMGDNVGTGKKKIGGFGKGGKMPAMFPLRVERSRHEEKVAPPTIFKDPETNAQKKVREKKGKVKIEDGVQVKPEPTDDDDLTLPDAPPAIPSSSAPSSPELAKKSIKTSQSPEALRKAMPPPATPGPGGKQRRKSSSATRKGRRLHSTSIEEEREFKREEEDRMATLRELGVALPAIESLPQPEGGSEEEAAAETAADISSIKPGDLFFFQFPSVLPPLIPIAPPGSTTADPSATPADATAPPTSATPAPSASSTGATRRKNQKKPTVSSINSPLPSGAVGQLRIHKSGRVSILWGHPDPTGTPQAQPIEMDVARGADCEFLQDVVVIKSEEGGVSEDGTVRKPGGTVYSMGQVRGRFVVSPELGKLTEEAAKSAAGRSGLVVL